MSRVADQLSSLLPALAFLLAGVPLAALLDRLGFFEATAGLFCRRTRGIPVSGLWVLAAATTMVLNLDTTVVLLTPLMLRLARRTETDPIALTAIPLLLASLASSMLPVSNLTTLIVVDRLHVGVGEVVAHLGLPCLAAVLVGWFAYRRRHPTRLPSVPAFAVDRRALRIGSLIVAGLLVGFVLGPSVGIEPWITATAADVVLIVVTRTVPWRTVPLRTALAVAALGALAALAVPPRAFSGFLGHSSPLALTGIATGAAGAANAVNNLPALLLALDGVRNMSWGMWAWLLGVNTGAVFLPLGALANLLWLRVLRVEGLAMTVRRYLTITVPVALPAFVAALAVLAAERAVAAAWS